MGPEALAQVLRPLAGMVPPERRADLIVGLSEGDDAAVYRLNETTALIFTADFFTPVVDDPYTFGQIAAANSLSDIYATGGEPILALNLAAFPADMDKELISQIFLGGAELAASAGCAVAGGHTILDKEPKFGMAVLGIAHPDRLLLKKGAQAGDVLILTKALGTGIITTAAKAQNVESAWIDGAIDSMKKLNKDAMQAFLAAKARAATDITGFSLIGHALEIAEKSKVDLEINVEALNFLPGAFECVARKHVPGGAVRNRKAFEPRVRFKGWSAETKQEGFRTLVFAPETSGGLLGAIPPENAETCLATLRERGLEAAIIGRCLPLGGSASIIRFL
jgi:selenide,water dikinase